MAWEDFIKYMSAVTTKASNHVLSLKVTLKEQLLILNLMFSQSRCWSVSSPWCSCIAGWEAPDVSQALPIVPSFTQQHAHYMHISEELNPQIIILLVLLKIAQSVQWLGYGLDTLGFNSRQRQKFFFFSKMARVVLGPIQPPLQWLPEALPLGVKWPKHEGNYSPDLILSLMSRAVLLLPLCAIMASTGAVLPF